MGFTVLDAIPVFPPTNDVTNDHTNHNGQLDFMNPNAERGAANAALAAPSSRTSLASQAKLGSTIDKSSSSQAQQA